MNKNDSILNWILTLCIIAFSLALCSGCAHGAEKPQMVKPKKHYFSEALIEGVKHFENAPLAVGRVKVDKRRYDKLGGVYEIGYGFTSGCIYDAIREGYLPKGYKIPARMTKAEADTFLVNIVLPTYQKIVKDTVKVKLTRKQQESLIMFTFNLGRNALDRLVSGDNRLNSGNYKRTPKIMMRYVIAGGRRVQGLVRRRTYEKNLWHG